MPAHDHREEHARFAALALAGATAALASSLWIENEIGGAVLYGAFAALLVGAGVVYALASVGGRRPRRRIDLDRAGATHARRTAAPMPD